MHAKSQVLCLGSCFYYGVKAASTMASGLPSAQSLSSPPDGHRRGLRAGPSESQPLSPSGWVTLSNQTSACFFLAFSFFALILLGSQLLQTRVLCQMCVSIQIKQGSSS